MKFFLVLAALAGFASAAPQFLAAHRVVALRPAGQVSHQSVSKPFQGEHRATTQSKAFGSSVATVSDSPNVQHGRRLIGHGLVGHGVISHGILGHPVVASGVHAVAHPVVHAVVAHPVAYAPGRAEVYPDEVSPYTYQYTVADDYSGSRFSATETDDGTAARTGSYSVNLPDGRIQTVTYYANNIDGYVAEVTYA